MCAHPPCSGVGPERERLEVALHEEGTGDGAPAPLEHGPGRVEADGGGAEVGGVATGAAPQVDAQRPGRDPPGEGHGPRSAARAGGAPPTRGRAPRRSRRWPGPYCIVPRRGPVEDPFVEDQSRRGPDGWPPGMPTR